MNKRFNATVITLALAVSLAPLSALASEDAKSVNPHANIPMHGMMPGDMDDSMMNMHGSMMDRMGPMKGHMMGSHPGEHGPYSNYRDLHPRNAALNFLRMDKMLNLSGEQKTALRKLRDAWIQNQSVAEAEVKVARNDLVHMIYSDIDIQIIDAQLKKIGQLEGSLWKGFVDQYKEIMKILNDSQKKMVLDDNYMN